MESKPRFTKQIQENGRTARTKLKSSLEETRFLFLGTKVLDEMKILARLASPSKGPPGKA